MAMVCTTSYIKRQRNGVIASVLCTFDTTPGTATDTLPDDVQAMVNDHFVHAIYTIPGATGPTDDSDLAITDAEGKAIYTGTNVIDNATVNGPLLPVGPTTAKDWHHPMGDGNDWTITITNNAVDSSTCEIVFQLTKAPEN